MSKVFTELLSGAKPELQPLVSICIPTNGVFESVFTVLNSIYSQDTDLKRYEVIVMDNGGREAFRKRILDYARGKSNLLYYRTTAFQFLNEIEAYKAASGKLIKFLNHRNPLLSGSLDIFCDFAEQNQKEAPVIYFSNGVLKGTKEIFRLSSFDAFIRKLSYWSSWSTGMAFWKKDFEKMDLSSPNELFPHTSILFAERHRANYIVDNRILLSEIENGSKKKGKYNLFHAFAVEYPNLIRQLYRDGDISKETYQSVLNDNLTFLGGLYFAYVICKEECSYDLSGYQDSIKVYYSMPALRWGMVRNLVSRIPNIPGRIRRTLSHH